MAEDDPLFHESGVTRKVYDGAVVALERNGMQLHYDGDGAWRVEGGRGSPYTFSGDGHHGEEGIFAMSVLRILSYEHERAKVLAYRWRRPDGSEVIIDASEIDIVTEYATGGVVEGAHIHLVGEDGPERMVEGEHPGEIRTGWTWSWP